MRINRLLLCLLVGLFLFLVTACAHSSNVDWDLIEQQFGGVDTPDDSTYPRRINGMWFIDGQVWYMTHSSFLFCEDGRSVDFPTYKVCWNPKQQCFYYVYRGSLFSYNISKDITEEICRINNYSHYLKAVTDNYAIVGEYKGTRCFQVELNTHKVQKVPVNIEDVLSYDGDRILYGANKVLYEYSCDDKESTLLYKPEDTECRLVSACYMNNDILFVYRWGDFKQNGTLFLHDRQTTRVFSADVQDNAVAVYWNENVLLLVSAIWNSENYGNLHLYKIMPSGEAMEIILDENLPYIALVNTCQVMTDGQRFAISCRGDIIIEAIE